MTVYFHRVFKKLSERADLNFQAMDAATVDFSKADILMSHDSQIELAEIERPWRASHMIRDPRDLLISAYFYHLRTNEKWCAKPNPDHTDLPPDISYQHHLRSLDQEAGIKYEMSHVSARMLELMGAWDYASPNVMELRFEEVLGNETLWFKRLFTWYGFNKKLVSEGVAAARQLALRNLQPGDSSLRHRNRKSRPGYWREYFTDSIKADFKNRFGQTLVKLGYEPDLDW
jgi:hypothetical protein